LAERPVRSTKDAREIAGGRADNGHGPRAAKS
jgi:hypothetical protein